MEELIEELEEEQTLRTPEIKNAFLAIDRKDFVPKEMQGFAYINEALPIGRDQTISQPSVVAFMLEELEPKEGQTILDIGSGSGWTSALLAAIVGNQGKVISIELIPKLAAFGKKNIASYNFIKKGIVKCVQGNGAQGYPSYAPYERILISAALPSKTVPPELLDQLGPEGILVTPIRNSIWKITKQHEDAFQWKEYPGYEFVPFQIPKTHEVL